MYQSGFVTGHTKEVIPWKTLKLNPSLWISADCYPANYPWEDPSHLTIPIIFLLLNHWRVRKKAGLDPLIWVTTSPLFDDAVDSSERGRTVRKARVLQELQDSDEEAFVLPSSGDFDQEDEDDKSDGHESSAEEPSSVGNSSGGGESMDLDAEQDAESPTLHLSYPLEGSSGEHYVYLIF
jgi:hypothetical protein